MDEIDTLVEEFWKKLEKILHLLAVQLLYNYTDFKYHVGKSSNNAFLLRVYLSILKSNEGDELSISIDVKKSKDGLLIESDVVGEEGVIIADGPSLELYGDLSSPSVIIKIEEWFELFERMLADKSKDIDEAIKNLR